MPEQNFQPAEAASVDTYIDEGAPAANFGGAATLRLALDNAGNNEDILFKFDLSPIEKGSTIETARLDLWLNSEVGGAGALGTSYITRILDGNAGWTEGGATWNTQDGANAWAGAAGCETRGTDIANTDMWSGDIFQGAAPRLNSYTLDTQEFQALIDVGNNGFKIWSGVRAPAVNRDHTFASAADANPARHPLLYVRWIEPSGRLVEYTFDVWDPRKRILDDKGRIVPPEEVEPDNWMEVLGISMPEAKVYASLVEDPSMIYIVETMMTEQGLRIKGNRSDFADVIISRAAGGKG